MSPGKRLTLEHFNSQPHKEADVFLIRYTNPIVISTHSLTRRLTRIGSEKDVCMMLIFQLTASQGG